jgi:hypothetical protein
MFNLKSPKLPRLQEYKALFYRIGLVYVFYFVARVLFYFYNSDLVNISSIFEFFRLYWHGLAFDTTAILYVNALFIVFSVLPLKVNATKGYQKFLILLYFLDEPSRIRDELHRPDLLPVQFRKIDQRADRIDRA